MSTTMSVDQVQANLAEIIGNLDAGEELIITKDKQPVARLVGESAKAAPASRPGPGLCKGMITFMAPDFDAPLDDMKEYMQ
jgi:antitoxin (DNA-binding transcriptional repressor) of toxin-antitoxin stability system